MSVHYKFKSSLDYDTVTFDGLHISVADLKKSIIQQKKIGKSSDFDLQITNAQTKEVYKEDDALIPKNSSVIVARIPIPGASKKTWERNDSSSPLLSAKSSDSPSDSLSFDKLTKTADLTSINASEDDKIKAMMTQATQDYDPSKYIKVKGMAGPIPSTYLCYRCGKPGHWIKNCPTNNNEVKRSTGIPRSFMVAVDGPEVPGALLTNTGHFAVPVIDHEAYKEGKKERPPFAKEPTPEKEEKPVIPEELLCMICRDLLSDAVLIPCCGNSYCDECVRQALLDSDEHECPTCHEKDISPDTLIPNRFLRTAVMNFKNETGYTKIKKIIKSLNNPPASLPSPKLSPPSSSQLSVSPPHPTVVEQIKSEPDNLQVEVPPAIPEQPTNNEDNADDDRPGTPVRDEKPDESNSVAVMPLQHYPITKQEKSLPPTTLGIGPSTKPLNQHPQKTEGKQGGYTISTITTRQPRIPFSHIYPSPYVSKRPRNGTSTTTHSRSSHQQSVTYSPKREHYSHHASSSSHGSYSQPSPLYNTLLPLPSHSSSVTHLHGPPTHLGPSQTSGTHHPFPATQVPPTRILPPRGPPPPGYPPQPPPPGSLPLNSSHYDQPPPPGIQLPVPSHSAQHHGNYDYYREHKDRPKDALGDFERELMEYKFDRQRHNSRSPSRSFISSRSSSRSRSHSVSRSVTHSSRSHSRSRSYSYSRSRSTSLSRSRSRSRSRSHSYRRSRTRSRSRGRHYSPAYRRSRSRSPYNKSRSPFRRGYSPSYYNPVYRYQAPMTSTYSPDSRNRFYHQHYRYDEYQFGEQRFDSHDPHYNPRFEYGHYEDLYRDHDKHRSWTPEGREKERRENRKIRTHDVLKKDDRVRSPYTHKDKENDKKSQKRHHKSKTKKERDQNAYYHKEKMHRDEPIQKVESEEYTHESKSEKYDTHVKHHSAKKIDRHVESDVDVKSKDKKHKLKTKKLQEQVKVKSKNEKTSEEDASDARELPIQTPTTKISNKRILRYKHHRRISGSEELSRESDPHKINPNIIVIKTESEVKTKVTKDTKEVSEKSTSEQNNAIVDSESSEVKKESECSDPIEEQGKAQDVKEVEELEILPEMLESHKTNEQEPSSEIIDEKPIEEVKKDSVVEEEEVEGEVEEEEEEMEEYDEQELDPELENEQDQELTHDQEEGILEIEEEPSELGDPVLTAQIPELSKWERDDSELDESISPERETKYPSPKMLKALPPDIVERAEKAILHKPVKPTVVNSCTDKTGTAKLGEKKVKPHDKISPKLKSVPSNDVREVKPDVATLQITISGKDKRSVEAKDSSNVREKKDYEELKNKNKSKEKIKLDRSKFHSKYLHEDDVGYRSIKVRASRSKLHTPDRDSFSPGKKDLLLQDSKMLKLEMNRNKGFDVEVKQSKYKGSPKREKFLEDRERKMKQYDRENFRNTKQNSNEKMFIGFQSEQKRRDGQRLMKDTEDYKRKGSDDVNERSKGRGRSEKEKSRESPDRRQENPDYAYKIEKHQNDKEKSEKHEKKKSSAKDGISRKFNKNCSKEKPNISDSEAEETKYSSEDKERKIFKYASDDNQYMNEFEENADHTNKMNFSENERTVLIPSKNKPSVSHEQYISKHRDRRKSTIDESKFEPDYDESSESDHEMNQESVINEPKAIKMKRSSSQSPERLSKKVKKEKPTMSDSEAIFTHLTLIEPSKNDSQQDEYEKGNDKSESSSSSSSDSGSVSPVPIQLNAISPKKKLDINQPLAQVVKEKHKHKKSKHKKHKKHKHKHKKKKGHHKSKHKEESKEGKVKSSIAKN